MADGMFDAHDETRRENENHEVEAAAAMTIESVRASATAILDYADINLTMMEAAGCPTGKAEDVYNAARALVESLGMD